MVTGNGCQFVHYVVPYQQVWLYVLLFWVKIGYNPLPKFYDYGYDRENLIQSSLNRIFWIDPKSVGVFFFVLMSLFSLSNFPKVIRWHCKEMMNNRVQKHFLEKKWYFVTKIVLTYWEKIILVIEKNSRLKAENFQKFWDHFNNWF